LIIVDVAGVDGLGGLFLERERAGEQCYSNRNRSCPYVDCNGKSRCETRDVNFLEIRRAVAAGSATHPPWVGKLAA